MGALGSGSGPFLSGNVAVDVGTGLRIQTTHSTIADSVRLGTGAIVGDVQTNRFVDGNGTQHGGVTPMVPLPALPAAQTVTPGPTNLMVASNAKTTAAAGGFATVSIGTGGTLRLSGGLYQVRDMNLSSGARLEALAPVEIRIANRLNASSGIFVGAAAGVTLAARDLRIEVTGANGGAGGLNDSPKAAAFASGNQLTALVLVPNGTLSIGTGLVATGAFLARDVDVGSSARVVFQDGFAPACTAGGCSDGNPCTTDGCGANGCTHAAVAAGTACPDGNACNGAETCSANGACGPGSPPVVDDGNACTTDSCNPSTGVSHLARAAGSACADGDLCNGNETCDGAGTCRPGTAVQCNAIDACHSAGTCNPQTGACTNPLAPDGTACNDGNLCTQQDRCMGGTCTSGSAIACTASDACHVTGTCNAATGTCTSPAAPDGTPCTDGDLCTQQDHCAAGVCAGGAAIACVALDACHGTGTCNPQTGTCTNPLAPDGTACNDSDACTQHDACSAGTCRAGAPVVCTASDACHVAGLCDHGTGICSNPVAADGTGCDDGDACKRHDECSAGVCTGTDPVACTPSDQCHAAGTCSPATGACSNPPVPDGTACDDGDACTQRDACGAGACSGGAVVCAASDSCHVAGTCNPSTGACSNPVAPDGTGCDDGDKCTKQDACSAGTCNGGAAVVCTASDACHIAGVCDHASGTCTNPVAPDGQDCSDGDACTKNDACNAGACVGGASVTCPPATCELTWSCDSQTGQCVSAAATGAGGCARLLVGRVLSDATGVPLPDATIRVGSASTVSSADGRYLVRTTESSATVQIERAGFTSATRVVDLVPNTGNSALDARLTPRGDATTLGPSGGTLHATLNRWGPPIAAALSLPAAALAQDHELWLTPLSPQGLPLPLPLGWSPLAAFELHAAPAASFAAPVPLAVQGLPDGTLVLAAYDASAQQWRVLQPVLSPASGGVAVQLPATGSYALLVADAPFGPVASAVGDPLAGVSAVPIPPVVSAAAVAQPAVLPASGGLVEGRVLLPSTAPLPSGTRASLATSEVYRLTNGTFASTETTVQDLALYRAPLPSVTAPATTGATSVLGASFPITPSFSYRSADLARGTVHLDVLAGRENQRGTIAAAAATAVTGGGMTLELPANALSAPTLIDLEASSLAEFVPSSSVFTPLTQVALDFSGADLAAPAALRFDDLAVASGTTPLLAQLVRIDGVAYPSAVAVGVPSSATVRFAPSPELSGITREGSYVAYAASGPFGFVRGTTSAAGAPVQALVTATGQPFAAVSSIDGSYRLPVAAGSVTIQARVAGSNLVASTATIVPGGSTTTLNLALQGQVTQGTVVPVDRAVDVEWTAPVQITTSAPLDESTVTAANVRLVTGAQSGGEPIAARLVLNSSGTTLSLIADARLTPGTAYTLQASGLRDTYGSLVAVPLTTFTTRFDVPPEYHTEAIQFSLPDDGGVTHLYGPPGTLAAGSTILITNEGNGAVVSFTAFNDGSVLGDLPASIDDRLVISITDPFGNTTTFTRSQFVGDGGKVAVGPGGGVVMGEGGVELRIPEGALSTGVVFDIEARGPDAFPERPYLPDSHFGGVLHVEAQGNAVFKKEVDLVFPKPPDAPDGAFYYIYRRLDPPPGQTLPGGAAFEVIDHAFVEGTGTNAKVVTASCPFRGFLEVTNVVGQALAQANPFPAGAIGVSAFVLAWTYDQMAPGIPTTGLVRGRVLQAEWDSTSQTPRFKPIPNAIVSGRDASGQPFNSVEHPEQTVAVTQADGSYALWDRFPTSGQVKIAASRSGNVNPLAGCPATPGPQDDVRCATPVQEVLATCASNVGSYGNQITANITYPATAPPQPPPAIDIKVLRDANGGRQTTGGLVAVGQSLVLSFSAQNATVLTADVTHMGVRENPSVRMDTMRGQPLGGDSIATYTPADAGTYTVTARAQPLPQGSIVTHSIAFRVVAAGGSVVDPVPGAPGVISEAVFPQRGARSVPTTVFPELVFSEPVRNVPGHVKLEEASGALVPFALIGIGRDGVPIDLDVAGGSTREVTSLTLQPRTRLKFGTSYKVTLTSGIYDSDVASDGAPDPQPLTPYETTFTTVVPKALTPEGGTGFSSAGIATLGDLAVVVENRFQQGILRVFDISDPVSPTEIPAGQKSMAGRPMDIALQPDGAGAKVVVITGPTDVSMPSNLRIYRLSPSGQTEWIGAASLTVTATEGIAQHVAIHGDYAYATNSQRGVQVVDLAAAEELFRERGGDVSRVRIPLNTAGEGFGHEAVVASVPVLKPNALPAFLTDLAVADLVDGFVQPIAIATGELGLTTVNPATGEVLVASFQQGFFGRALDLMQHDGRTFAVVAGETQRGGPPALLIADVTNPRAPTLASNIFLPARPIDVVLHDGLALVGTDSAVVIVNVDDPFTPFIAGDVPGDGAIKEVAGRVAVAQSGVLLSSMPSTTGGEILLGGVRTATFGPLVSVLPIDTFFHKRVEQGAVTTVETTVPIDINFVAVEMDPSRPAHGEVEIRARAQGAGGGSSRLLAVMPATLQPSTSGFEGTTRLPAGTQLPAGEIITATALVSQSPAVRSIERVLPLPTPTLRVDSDNNTRLGRLGSDDDQSDESASTGFQFRRFVFWNIPAGARTRYVNSGCGQGAAPPRVCLDLKEDDLEDWASFKVRVHGALLREPKGTVTLVLDGHRWFLSKMVGEGKERFSNSTVAKDQLAAIKNEAYESDNYGRIDVPKTWLVNEDNDLLLSCFDCEPLDPHSMIIEYKEGNSLATLGGAAIDIQPLESMATMYSAHSDGAYEPITGSKYSPNPTFERITRWRQLPDDATKLTVIVHGFNVPQAESEDTFFTQYVKRLYWVGRSLFDGQGPSSERAAAVGISWPGDQGGLPPAFANFPTDEFHAFQTGIPLSVLLKSLSSGANGRRQIDVVAHSLGNIVVNSALAYGDGMDGLVHAYVMNEAAVPAEAFMTTYVEDPVMLAKAVQQGYPFDDDWADQWLQMNMDFCGRDFCGDCTEVVATPTPLKIGAAHLKNWCQRILAGAALSANAQYGFRWSSARYEHSPWRGIFATNLARTSIYNTYSTEDAVMGLGYQEMAVHQKPFIVSAIAGLIVNDSRSIGFWADLGLGGSNQLYLWDAPEQLQHADQVRRWAELAFWFNPLSRGAGFAPINLNPPGAGPQIHDVAFTAIAHAATAPLATSMTLASTLGPFFGISNPLDPAFVSHGYMVFGSLSQVWCGHFKVNALLETGSEAQCP